MSPRRALLLSVVVLFITVLALWPAQKTISLAVPHSQTVKPTSLLLVNSKPEKSQQSWIHENLDGSFSTKHPELVRDPNSRWTSPAKPVDVVFPRRFSEPVAIKSGDAFAQCVPLNANLNSHPEVMDDQTLIYRDAFTGCDVKYRSSMYKTEEFIVVKDSSALDANGIATWSWDIQTQYEGRRLKPRLTQMHTIELADEQDVPRLRIEAPFGKDSTGAPILAEKHLQFKVDGSRLTLLLDTNTLQLPLEIDPSWSSTGNLVVPRVGHTAEKLANGNIIVIGGLSTNSYLTSCEIFDFTSNTWSATGALNTARSNHASIKLNDGRILLTGGFTNGTPTLTCEIFDPGTNTWTTTSSLTVARGNHTLSLLSNGRVMAVGGDTNTSPYISSAEIFDPVTPGWTSTGALSTARSYHAAVTLQNGTIIIIGGQTTGNTPLASVELYNEGMGTWNATGSMNFPRALLKCGVLNDGSVLAVGGIFGSSTPLYEIYNLTTAQWTATGATFSVKQRHSATLLANGSILTVGGATNSDPKSMSCEVFNQDSGTGNNTAPLNIARLMHTATLLSNNKVLVASGSIFSNETSSCELFTPSPEVASASISTHAGIPINFELVGKMITGTRLLSGYTITASPSNGTITGTPPNLTYTPNSGFIGNDVLQFKVNDGFFESDIATINFNVANAAPTVSVTATPTAIAVGGIVQFTAIGGDSDGDSVSYTWDFGDGSTSSQQNPSHSYLIVGDYSVKVTIKDIFSAQNTANVVVHVGQTPTARFSTGDIVGFVGLPLTFDAALSTDPENAIAGYSWNFGDGSPLGNGQVLSKVYDAEGTFTVILTVFDAEGLMSTAQRLIEVLPADQIGVFNAFVEFKTTFDRSKTAKDTLTLKARINVGDSQIGDGSAVALEIAGQRFVATLDRKLRAAVKVAPKQTWKVQFATRKQSAGQVDVQVTIKNANLGLGFNQLGAVAGVDGSALITVPVQLEVGAYSFEISCDTDFEFNRAGTKAKGDGASE